MSNARVPGCFSLTRGLSRPFRHRFLHNPINNRIFVAQAIVPATANNHLLMKKQYLTPETEVDYVSFEESILSNGENLNVRDYHDEYDDDPWS